jgi:hypothetical protein
VFRVYNLVTEDGTQRYDTSYFKPFVPKPSKWHFGENIARADGL